MSEPSVESGDDLASSMLDGLLFDDSIDADQLSADELARVRLCRALSRQCLAFDVGLGVAGAAEHLSVVLGRLPVQQVDALAQRLVTLLGNKSAIVELAATWPDLEETYLDLAGNLGALDSAVMSSTDIDGYLMLAEQIRTSGVLRMAFEADPTGVRLHWLDYLIAAIDETIETLLLDATSEHLRSAGLAA